MAMDYSPDGKVLACGSYSGEVRLWSVDEGAPIEPALKGHIAAVARLAFSADSKTLVSGGADQTIRFWNVATRQEVLLIQEALMPSGDNRLLTDPHFAGQAEVTPGDRWMLWQGKPGSIRVTELPSLAEIEATRKDKSREP
jgi:WD40 repeat protein